MTRKLSILIAACAIALGATAGSASADPKIGPGCKGQDVKTTITSFSELLGTQGLDGALDAIGMSHEAYRDGRDAFCAPFEEPTFD